MVKYQIFLIDKLLPCLLIASTDNLDISSIITLFLMSVNLDFVTK